MTEEKTTDIQFFGDVDRDKRTGAVKHSYPAWYFTTKSDELEDEIRDLRTRIDRADELTGPASQMIPEMKRELRYKEEQFSNIMASKPTLSGKDKDSIAKVYEEIGNSIADSMFSYTDMQRGTVSAHEEAKLQTEPCVDVPHGAAMMMQKMGIRAERGGKISRNEAAKAWKIWGRLLGESTNVEKLRRDIVGGSYKIPRSLAEMERG